VLLALCFGAAAGRRRVRRRSIAAEGAGEFVHHVGEVVDMADERVTATVPVTEPNFMSDDN
jgi:hypothetical protein